VLVASSIGVKVIKREKIIPTIKLVMTLSIFKIAFILFSIYNVNMNVKFEIPDYVQKVARMLTKEGFVCYLVGGALRDVVLDIEPDDYDLATDATPDEMLKIFPKSVSTGSKVWNGKCNGG
jgi:N-acyl-D-aspartate/D-glutamate deacylase